MKRARNSAVDTCLWQTLASVLIPGKVIHTWVKFTKGRVGSFQNWGSMQVDPVKFGIFKNWLLKLARNPAFLRFAPTLLGLAAIPVIIHPIDRGVDYFMDNCLRGRVYDI